MRRVDPLRLARLRHQRKGLSTPGKPAVFGSAVSPMRLKGRVTGPSLDRGGQTPSRAAALAGRLKGRLQRPPGLGAAAPRALFGHAPARIHRCAWVGRRCPLQGSNVLPSSMTSPSGRFAIIDDAARVAPPTVPTTAHLGPLGEPRRSHDGQDRRCAGRAELVERTERARPPLLAGLCLQRGAGRCLGRVQARLCALSRRSGPSQGRVLRDSQRCAVRTAANAALQGTGTSAQSRPAAPANLAGARCTAEASRAARAAFLGPAPQTPAPRAPVRAVAPRTQPGLGAPRHRPRRRLLRRRRPGRWPGASRCPAADWCHRARAPPPAAAP